MLKELMFNKRPDILLNKMLDNAALSQRVIASNIANVSTPGYKRLGVSFNEQLKRAMRPGRPKLEVSNPRHIPSTDFVEKLKPAISRVENDYWNGINNVSIDREMVELAKIQLDFTIASRLKSIRFNQLKTAIRGRR